MIDPRNYVTAQPDVATRMMLERLARSGPIFKVSRLIKRGPLCPMCVLWLETVTEPGRPENDMRGTRSRHVAGFVSGQYIQPERVYTSGGPGTREITRAEYQAALAEIARNQERGIYDPRSDPFSVVRVEELPLPTWEKREMTYDSSERVLQAAIAWWETVALLRDEAGRSISFGRDYEPGWIKEARAVLEAKEKVN